MQGAKRGSYARRGSKDARRPLADDTWSIEGFKAACDAAMAQRGITTKKAGAGVHRPWGRLTV